MQKGQINLGDLVVFASGPYTGAVGKVVIIDEHGAYLKYVSGKRFHRGPWHVWWLAPYQNGIERAVKRL